MQHAFEAHSSEAKFKFSCGFCTQMFTVYSSMVSHLSRKHGSEPALQQEQASDEDNAGSIEPPGSDDVDDISIPTSSPRPD